MEMEVEYTTRSAIIDRPNEHIHEVLTTPEIEAILSSEISRKRLFNTCICKDLDLCNTIQNSVPLPIYRYSLETLYETRSLIESTKPYFHSRDFCRINEPNESLPKIPEDLFAIEFPDQDPIEFVDSSTEVINTRLLESTKKVKDCAKCTKSRRNGDRDDECQTCQGSGFVTTFKTLVIGRTVEVQTFSSHHDDNFLPEDLIKTEECVKIVLEKITTNEQPLSLNFPLDSRITQIAEDSIRRARHKENPYRRILQFRQKVGVIPAWKVVFDNNKKDGTCIIYGNHFKVYFPKKV